MASSIDNEKPQGSSDNCEPIRKILLGHKQRTISLLDYFKEEAKPVPESSGGLTITIDEKPRHFRAKDSDEWGLLWILRNALGIAEEAFQTVELLKDDLSFENVTILLEKSMRVGRLTTEVEMAQDGYWTRGVEAIEDSGRGGRNSAKLRGTNREIALTIYREERPKCKSEDGAFVRTAERVFKETGVDAAKDAIRRLVIKKLSKKERLMDR